MANKTLFRSFFVSFCAFCASLWLTRTVFSWLLKKAISMALWTKAGLCGKSSLLEQSLPRTPSRPKTSVISVNPVILSNFFSCSSCLRGEKIREISVNPWLINDLRAYNELYICRETITDVMDSLQIHLFIQNEPKFRKSQVNVNKVLTKDYDKMDTWSIGKNEPKTNPNEPNFKKAKMNVTVFYTKGYENKPPIRAPKKRTQFSLTTETNANLFGKKVYEKNALSGSEKTNSNEPNRTQFQRQKMLFSAFLLRDLVRIIMLFKSLSGKYRLKIILEMYPIIW